MRNIKHCCLKPSLLLLTLAILLLATAAPALAQDYAFQLLEETVNAYWNEDGTLSLDYRFVFRNDPNGHPIEFVDVGFPNPNFDEGAITASVDGHPLTNISADDFQGEGPGLASGVAVGLGQYAIPPGETGEVRVFSRTINRQVHPDTEDPEYASAVLAPAWFSSDAVSGTTRLTVIFHFPPGVQRNETRWHASPPGWPAQPITGVDEQGRVTYTWINPSASPSTKQDLGASFPRRYIPVEAVVNPSFWETSPVDPAILIVGGVFLFIALIIGFIMWLIYLSEKRRKLEYLPPSISIEGHGIKRGLTAVEAAALMQQPMDKILTMVLFSVVKKGAASVISRDPLELEIRQPVPGDLHGYEKQFLEAFALKPVSSRRKALRKAMINLLQSLSQKMKGFSRRETLAYYRDITQKAWAQVEAADTPEIKSEKFDQEFDWTLLDSDYDARTRRVFRDQPVYVPIWWGRFDPAYRTSGGGQTAAPASSGQGGGFNAPRLPGSDFAASMVTGVQSFSTGVVGNLTEFTGQVTKQTNPPPPPSSSRSGGSGGGGCACACAGCACACAGGGR